MTAVPPWLAAMREITGTVAQHDNPVILAWPKFIAQAYPDMAAYCAGYTHDTISWCGLTIGYCMAKAGIRPVFGASATDRFLWALAWLQFGQKVTAPQAGDVLVFDFGGGDHHVTLYESGDAVTYVCRGGNQSHQVKVSNYPASACIGIRRPATVPAVVGNTPSIAPTSASNYLQFRQSVLTQLAAIAEEVAAFDPGSAASVTQPPAAPPPAALEIQCGIIATVFGGAADSETSYYDGHVIGDDEPGCALPYPFPRKSPPLVCIKGPNGVTVTVPVIDLGPICPNKAKGFPADPFWLTNARPWAEQNNIRSRAGIDLTPRTARDLAIDGEGKVDFYFATNPGANMNPVTSSPVTSTIGATAIAGALTDLVANWNSKNWAGVVGSAAVILAGVMGLFAADGHK